MPSSGANARFAVARVERQHALIEEMRCATRRLTAAELAMRTGVSTRTVERDIASLQDAGVPVSVRPGPRGGFALTTVAFPPALELTPGELAALIASIAAIGPYSSATAESALRKLLAALGANPSPRN